MSCYIWTCSTTALVSLWQVPCACELNLPACTVLRCHACCRSRSLPCRAVPRACLLPLSLLSLPLLSLLFSPLLPFRIDSQNLDDCISKLQAMIDAAVEAVTPKEIDPETVKKVKAA